MGWAIEPNSFRRVYDYCRRKGQSIEPLFFHDEMLCYNNARVEVNRFFVNVLSGKKQNKKTFRKTLEKILSDYLEPKKLDMLFPEGATNALFEKKDVKRIKHLLSDEKKQRIYNKLSLLSLNMANEGIKWKLDSTIRTRRGKPVYSLERSDAGSFFACKILQQSIKERFRIIMSNRSTIIKQVCGLAAMKSPYSVIRTDINSFFESISISILVRKLEKSVLPQSQINAICNLLNLCKSQFKISGIPRGIGLSSYLSELYLLDFDKEIKELEQVIYYNRYVDDIIVVVKEDDYGKEKAASEVKKIMESAITKLGLSFHSDEEKNVIVSGPRPKGKSKKTIRFNYLGYNFTLTNDGVSLNISESKVEKYITRMDYAAWTYWNSPSVGLKERNQMFIDRIKFLSMKTRLNNNKRNVIAGLPNRYSLISEDSESISILDQHLLIICSRMPLSIKRSVGVGNKISFEKGFKSEKVLSFDNGYLKSITKIWNNV